LKNFKIEESLKIRLELLCKFYQNQINDTKNSIKNKISDNLQNLIQKLPHNSPIRRPILSFIKYNINEDIFKKFFRISDTTYKRLFSDKDFENSILNLKYSLGTQKNYIY